MRKKNQNPKSLGKNYDYDDTKTDFLEGSKTVAGRLKGSLVHLNLHLPIYLGMFLLFLVVFSLVAVFGLSGEIGRSYFRITTANFGLFTYLAPLIYFGLACILLTRSVYIFFTTKFWAIVGLLTSIFIIIGFFRNPDGMSFAGVIGGDMATLLKNSIGILPSVFLLSLVSLAALARIFETSLEEIIRHKFSTKKHLKTLGQNLEASLEEATENISDALNLEKKPDSRNETFFSKFNFLTWFNKKHKTSAPINHQTDELTEIFDDSKNLDQGLASEDSLPEEDVRESMFKAVSVEMSDFNTTKNSTKKNNSKTKFEEDNEVKKDNQRKVQIVHENYQRPPLSIYSFDTGKASAGDNKENARIIKRTLADFGISVEMDEVTVGPTVTRYALKPAQGVKIEKITNLANNIALELGVPSVSISRVMERSLIGIEVPNKHKARLGLGSLLEKKEFLNRPDKLTIVIGKDIYGDPVFMDLTKMPHLLIAGTTGAGKSSLIHVLIHSLIYKNSPYDLKFILIDPKKVEFGLYNHLPHLLTPVIKEPKKAIQTLNWLVQEMDRRYQILEEAGKQNINAYHHYLKDKYDKVLVHGDEFGVNLPEKLPFIVLVIDELADFMMKYPKEMESGIVKLAQMSRAVGIHLIIATQRPSTNVITGVIKANIPSRIALRVASQIDSRVIIDQGGAEKLLGYGDMLFVSSDGSHLKRIQSPYMQEDEIKDVVAYLRRTYDDVVVEELKIRDGNLISTQNLNSGWNENGRNPDDYVDKYNFVEEDEKYEEAKQIVLQTKKTSISNLQVRLGTGYARSAKLINMLEQAGIIKTITDNSGKQIKVVAGTESEKLEAEADKLIRNGNGSVNDSEDTKQQMDNHFNQDENFVPEKNSKSSTASNFFRF